MIGHCKVTLCQRHGLPVPRRLQILRDGFDSRLEAIAFDMYIGRLVNCRCKRFTISVLFSAAIEEEPVADVAGSPITGSESTSPTQIARQYSRYLSFYYYLLLFNVAMKHS